MRRRNWQQYNKQLVQRGSLTFLVDPKLFKNHKKNRGPGRGRPVEYSLQLIQILLVVKIHYRLAYRALEGFAKLFLSALLGHIKIPTCSLICKRAAALESCLPQLSHRRPAVVILDATGMKVVGEGEWKVHVHGRGRPRKWLKVHVAVDQETQEIVAEVTTESSVSDGSMTEELLCQVKATFLLTRCKSIPLLLASCWSLCSRLFLKSSALLKTLGFVIEFPQEHTGIGLWKVVDLLSCQHPSPASFPYCLGKKIVGQMS